MILAAVIIARNPAQYGFTMPDATAPAIEKVAVDGPVDLRRVAEWTNTPVDTIQQLNPELRRWTTPVRSSAYELTVPAGTADALRARLTGTTTADRGALNWHMVRPGETLTTIARKLRVARADLAEANYLTVRSRVRPGQKLVIPRAPATLMAAQPDRPAPVADARPAVERASLVSQPDADRETAAPARRVYRVKRGDTLSSIARLFETSVSELKAWNRLRSNRINPGQRLTVYAAE
jgi:membrane-bound lytic murein transglycosylase D